MQMLPEDEEGFVRIDTLEEHLEHLRTHAMLNALVESDMLSLRTHMVLRFRHLGLEEDGKMRLWNIKQALLQADQICLTRTHIHILLCLAKSDAFGNVNVADFLAMCSGVIPHMFDARLFVETAERLVHEHAEAARRAENEELAAMAAATKVKTTEEDEGSQEKAEVDSDTVEKVLIQVLSLNDEERKQTPALPPEKIYEILQINEKEVQSTQLSVFEITGLLAEMTPDAEGYIPYQDHIKKWIPIIFEQRKNKLLSRYLEEDSGAKLGYVIPEIQTLEGMFPLFPLGATPSSMRSKGRKHSKSRENSDFFQDSRRHSLRSDPPSYRRTSLASGADSAGSQGLGSRKIRRSLTMLGSRETPKAKEPPPGRGYQRRKALLEAASAMTQTSQSVPASPAKP